MGAAGDVALGPAPGARAPDARGLERGGVSGPVRLFELLRGPEHVLLLWTDRDAEGLDEVAAAARERAHGRLRAFAVLPPGAPEPRLETPVISDAAGEFAGAYGAAGRCALLVRPDGYVSYRQSRVDAEALAAHLACTFA